MKTIKQLLVVGILAISFSTFAQKDELKAISKSIDKNNYAEAITTLSKVKGMLSSMDNKLKSKYYYLAVKAFNGKGDLDKAVSAINNLTEFEKSIGKSKYTNEVKETLDLLLKNVRDRGIKEYETKNWSAAKVTLNKVFELSKQDTMFLEYAAMAANSDKDYDLAKKYYSKLINVNFKGTGKSFVAINKETNKEENFNSKVQMDLAVKVGTHIKPEVRDNPSRRPNVYNGLINAYSKSKDLENAKKTADKARKEFPKDINLILSTASVEYKLGNDQKFADLMNEALEQNPNDSSIYFNLGIVNGKMGKYNEAIKAYKKAIELKPDNADAWLNLAYATLGPEKELVKKMEDNINNFDIFDKYEAQQKDLYRSALPTFVKALEYNQSNESLLKSMITIYEKLEMYDKMKEIRAKLDALK